MERCGPGERILMGSLALSIITVKKLEKVLFIYKDENFGHSNVVKIPTQLIVKEIEGQRIVDFDLGEEISIFLTSNLFE